MFAAINTKQKQPHRELGADLNRKDEANDRLATVMVHSNLHWV